MTTLVLACIIVLSMEFYTAKELAELLKLNIDTIRRYLRTGKIKASKFGKTYRVSDEDLKRFLEETKVK